MRGKVTKTIELQGKSPKYQQEYAENDFQIEKKTLFTHFCCSCKVDTFMEKLCYFLWLFETNSSIIGAAQHSGAFSNIFGTTSPKVFLGLNIHWNIVALCVFVETFMKIYEKTMKNYVDYLRLQRYPKSVLEQVLFLSNWSCLLGRRLECRALQLPVSPCGLAGL